MDLRCHVVQCAKFCVKESATIATLKTLGATRRTIFLSYFFQIAVLTLIGVALGVILGAAIPLSFAPLIEARLPIPASFSLYPTPLIEAAIYGSSPP